MNKNTDNFNVQNEFIVILKRIKEKNVKIVS